MKIFLFTFLKIFLSTNILYSNDSNTDKKWGSDNLTLDGGVQYYIDDGYKLTYFSTMQGVLVYILRKGKKIVSCYQEPGLRSTKCSIP